jgi:hypothetical protein
MNQGINHPGAHSARPDTGHRYFEYGFIPPRRSEKYPATERIWVCSKVGEYFVVPNQNDVVGNAYHNAFETLKLPEIEAAAKEICSQRPHVEVGECVERLEAFVFASFISGESDIGPSLVVPKGCQNHLQRIHSRPDLCLESHTVRPSKDIRVVVGLPVFKVLFAVDVAVAAPGRQTVVSAPRRRSASTGAGRRGADYTATLCTGCWCDKRQRSHGKQPMPCTVRKGRADTHRVLPSRVLLVESAVERSGQRHGSVDDLAVAKQGDGAIARQMILTREVESVAMFGGGSTKQNFGLAACDRKLLDTLCVCVCVCVYVRLTL